MFVFYDNGLSAVNWADEETGKQNIRPIMQPVGDNGKACETVALRHKTVPEGWLRPGTTTIRAGNGLVFYGYVMSCVYSQVGLVKRCVCPVLSPFLGVLGEPWFEVWLPF